MSQNFKKDCYFGTVKKYEQFNQENAKYYLGVKTVLGNKDGKLTLFDGEMLVEVEQEFNLKIGLIEVKLTPGEYYFFDSADKITVRCLSGMAEVRSKNGNLKQITEGFEVHIDDKEFSESTFSSLRVIPLESHLLSYSKLKKLNSSQIVAYAKKFKAKHKNYVAWLEDLNHTLIERMIAEEKKEKADAEQRKKMIERQKKGHWDLTLANAWGVLAVEKFAAAFEKENVTGTTSASYASQTKNLDWVKQVKGGELAFSWQPRTENFTVKHTGGGKPWMTLQSFAAIPLKNALSSGYRIQKTWIPVEQKTKGAWTRGDVVKVRLEMDAQTDRSWVVVQDPIPAGASILGSGLGRDSQLSTQGEEQKGRADLAFVERSFENYRAYYQYVPKGAWTLEYTIRLNQNGVLQMPATRVEAMYSPELFGESPNSDFKIVESD
ncbi:MAG: hypothetical protein HUU56_11990 [Bdellovibrionaceae bacterium]|nr:hypothetical protein [Pseudobdellovibrionaceae bacterium]